MSCGVGCQHSSDLALLWLWCRPAATVLFQLLAWEPPYAAGMALKRKERKRGREEGKKGGWIFVLNPALKSKERKEGGRQADRIFHMESSFLKFIYLLIGHTHGTQNFPGRGSNPHHSSDNANTLTTRPPRELQVQLFVLDGRGGSAHCHLIHRYKQWGFQWLLPFCLICIICPTSSFFVCCLLIF